MTNYDLCLAWNWEHDSGFAAVLSGACVEQSVSLLQVTPSNLAVIVQAM